MLTIAVHGAACEADGHPTECSEPATGSVEDADDATNVTVNGVPLADHGDVMNFPSHAHAYEDTDGDGVKDSCTQLSSHDLTPDNTPALTVDGQPVMRVGDATTDPGSGGVAQIVDSGGSSAITHTE